MQAKLRNCLGRKMRLPRWLLCLLMLKSFSLPAGNVVLFDFFNDNNKSKQQVVLENLVTSQQTLPYISWYGVFEREHDKINNGNKVTAAYRGKFNNGLFYGELSFANYENITIASDNGVSENGLWQSTDTTWVSQSQIVLNLIVDKYKDINDNLKTKDRQVRITPSFSIINGTAQTFSVTHQQDVSSMTSTDEITVTQIDTTETTTYTDVNVRTKQVNFGIETEYSCLQRNEDSSINKDYFLGANLTFDYLENKIEQIVTYNVNQHGRINIDDHTYRYETNYAGGSHDENTDKTWTIALSPFGWIRKFGWPKDFYEVYAGGAITLASKDFIPNLKNNLYLVAGISKFTPLGSGNTREISVAGVINSEVSKLEIRLREGDLNHIVSDKQKMKLRVRNNPEIKRKMMEREFEQTEVGRNYVSFSVGQNKKQGLPQGWYWQIEGEKENPFNVTPPTKFYVHSLGGNLTFTYTNTGLVPSIGGKTILMIRNNCFEIDARAAFTTYPFTTITVTGYFN